MRSIWKGAISFGLVSVPVKVYSATEDHDIKLHQVHDKDRGRIRYQRRCEVCGEVVEYADIDKAYEEGGRTVVLTDEDLESLPVERSREIEVVEFVPDEQIDPMFFEKSYYLEPEKVGVKPYQLLRRTLEQTELTAVVKFALRQKTRLGALRVRGDVMVLQSLLWPDEVREAAFPILEDTDVKISDKELKMSSSLVESLSSEFEPEQFTDEYQEQLRQLLEAKLAKGDAVDTEETFGAPAEEGEGAEVLDLMEALRRSVESRRKASGAPSAAPASGTRASGTKASGSRSAKAKAADDAEGSPKEEKVPPKRRTRKTG
ncbi:Ku protein [Sinomonas sp. R1AF57]|uniref:non-homologous end joining protein Ku n=1 Tax=Sinomonas sp. R1AF57 TaxID=2020377 RepID=UPI000B5EB165|nr:Ku protein [Sinomonas sp. R1AF57]ASN53075.1 Ku protein [Sinomonas sp. R1AF57]